MIERPVFVLGTGRCGSSLVHEVVARHEQAGFVTNLDDLGVALSSRRQNELWRRLPANVTRKGGARFAPSEGYRALAKEVGPLFVDPFRDLTEADATPWLQDRMQGFFERRAARIQAPVLLHKFTGWPRSGFLEACFPHATFVEVVRDGRAVANSWLQMPWWRGHRGPSEWHFGPLPSDLEAQWERHGRSFPVLAMIGWRVLMDAYDSAREAVPSERWLRVQYEDVVADPRGGVSDILRHVGLEWTESFEAGFSRYTFASGRTAAFERDLTRRDLTAMEAFMSTNRAE